MIDYNLNIEIKEKELITIDFEEKSLININISNQDLVSIDFLPKELITIDLNLIDVLKNLYLENLLDVEMTNITDDQAIVRESGKWKNKDRVKKSETLDDAQNNLSTAEEVREAMDFLESTSGLFESDENNDLMPRMSTISDFEKDENNDIMPTESGVAYIDEDFELDENNDIMPRE